MVSTASISSLGSLRPFIERAFRRPVPARNETPEIPFRAPAPLPHSDTPPSGEIAMTGS